MIRIAFLTIVSLLVLGNVALAQNNTLPTVELETLDGRKVKTTDVFTNDGNPIIISFWSTWCKPCIKELTTIQDEYIDWQEETGVKLIAISIDDNRTSSGVPMIVNAKGWEYEIYLDKNSDFKRAMNVVNIPHTLLLNDKLEVVWQHTSYAPGDEEELYEQVLLLKENQGSGNK
ncbi:MAG: TlpA family protein disulfide reductase [Bacteroidetes bacterium]|nr:TlpA family protein disulfide reductase [Bacteroidota bacterium]